MWISTDPALGDYIPVAPTNDEAKQHNSKLPGMGGVFNHINLNCYHYAGNNPVKYVDPDGRKVRKLTDGQWTIVKTNLDNLSANLGTLINKLDACANDVDKIGFKNC